MRPESLMLYKLIILYILDSVEFPLTNNQITSFILEKEYTNYLNVQEALGELLEDEYLEVESERVRQFYHITESGREALALFRSSIFPGIRTEIDTYLRENQYQLREEVTVRSNFYRAKGGDYVVHLRILERKSAIIDLKIPVLTEEEANRLCKNWEKKNAELYSYILSHLLKE